MCHKPFSSLSRLGWDISKFLKTWMRSDHFQVFKAWMRSDFFWWVIFKFLKTWISWCCSFIATWENLVWSTLMVVMSLKDPFSRLSRLGWGLDIPVRETCSSLWGMSSLLVTLSPPSACLVWNQHLLSKKTRDGPCWWPRRYSHSCQGRHAKKKRLLLGLGVGG